MAFADHEVEAVEREPHFGGDDFADGTGVFAGPFDTREDGVGILAIEGEELDDVVAGVVFVVLLVELFVAGGPDKRTPLAPPPPAVAFRVGIVDLGDVEFEMEVHVGRSGRRFSGALDVAVHPVDGFGNAGSA